MNMLSTDPRGPKAVALATDAGQWIKCRTRDGRKAYGIPSSTDAGHYYLTGRNFCTCPARMHRPGEDCKHMLAVQLHVDLVAEQEARASVGPDNIIHFDQTVAAIRTAAQQVDRSQLTRILGKPLPKPRAVHNHDYGVIPTAQIERED
jgi:predicted nucleic acid-binding Zn finger protein